MKWRTDIEEIQNKLKIYSYNLQEQLSFTERQQEQKIKEITCYYENLLKFFIRVILISNIAQALFWAIAIR